MGVKNAKVSDTFVEIIMRLYKNEDVEDLMKQLNSNETHLYNSIIVMAGLHKKFKTSHSKTIQDLKNQFKICEGELTSGNNNPIIINNMKEILLRLYHLNAISITEIKKYLKQFE